MSALIAARPALVTAKMFGGMITRIAVMSARKSLNQIQEF